MTIVHISAYKFISLKDLETRQADLLALCQSLRLKGTILLSGEGINLMLAGVTEAIETFKAHLQRDPAFADMEFKNSVWQQVPFKRLWVKIKKALIPMPIEVDPLNEAAHYVEPDVLKQWLDEQRDIVLLDTRNAFEVAYGAFVNTEQLHLSQFSEFPEALKQLPDTYKEKIIVTYCTGGIRCEKATAVMRKQGFKSVYQLHGGILKYFELCGGVHYRGDCYVFDERIAVDASLTPTGKQQCRHCSAPITLAQVSASISTSMRLCPRCAVPETSAVA